MLENFNFQSQSKTYYFGRKKNVFDPSDCTKLNSYFFNDDLYEQMKIFFEDMFDQSEHKNYTTCNGFFLRSVLFEKLKSCKYNENTKCLRPHSNKEWGDSFTEKKHV